MTRVRLLVLCAFALLAVPSVAGAHGSMIDPVSRVLACYEEGAEHPASPACKQAVAVGGTQPLYDWNEINRADANGNSHTLIPDGRICSGGRDKYVAFDAARTDWPTTHMPSGQPYTFKFRYTAAHLGHFELYVTKPGYDPAKPLKWSDLEEFFRQTNPPQLGGNYEMHTTLPERDGQQVIFALWQRSDSMEAFYSCSDVWFGDTPPLPNTDLQAPTVPANLRLTGTTSNSISLQWDAATDNVGVAGYDVLSSGVVVATTQDTIATVSGLAPDTAYSFTVRARDDAGNRSASSAPSAARTDKGIVPTPTPTPSVTPTPTPTQACSGFTTTSDWGSGYVGSVAVKNTGLTTMDGWTYTFLLPTDATITGYWSARLARSGSTVTFTPESWTKTIAAGGSASFGFQVSGSTKPSSCSLSR